MRTLPFIASLALVITACKGAPKHQTPPENARAGAAGSGSGGRTEAPNIQLPQSDGSPIKPTTGMLDEATLHKLQDMTFQGFKAHPHGLGAKNGSMEVQERTPDHPTIWVVITIASCQDKLILPACIPMDVAQWKAEPRLSELKAILPAELRAQSDTVFEVGQTEMFGAKMIYTYQLGQTMSHPTTTSTPGSAFDPGGFSFTNAYFLYYNDGVNQIRVVAEFKDEPGATKEKMAQMVPKGDLETAARAFMDVYTHAW